MAEPSSSKDAPRGWQAACTFCGAKVTFQSPISPMAVCSFCRSTLVRDGETLRRTGRSGVLFDDHSPLKLGTQGRWQGEGFALVGRIQLSYPDEGGQIGRWSEWQVVFDNGRPATLSEDNGGHVLCFPFDLDAQQLAAIPDTLVGTDRYIGGQRWTLSSRVEASVHALEGEVFHAPQVSGSFTVWEWRNADGEVLSVEDAPGGRRADKGRSVQLDDLQLGGSFDAGAPSEAHVKAQALECPHCGASVTPRLSQSKTVVCDSCRSVIDISKGLGADLDHYQQNNALEPLIPLGLVGQISVGGRTSKWQVVGYQERCEEAESPDDEQTFWREYLLYERTRGFAFLVDSEEGWSVVSPITGAPKVSGHGVKWRGRQYSLQYSYGAVTTYVLGEFYWPVRKGQRTRNTDYACREGGKNHLLNRESSGSEVVWSAGETIDHQMVMRAFGLSKQPVAAFKRDTRPTGDGVFWGLPTWAWLLILFVLIVILLAQCSDDCDDVKDRYGDQSAEYRQCRHSSGGSSGRSSWGSSHGGYSSGGFHK